MSPESAPCLIKLAQTQVTCVDAKHVFLNLGQCNVKRIMNAWKRIGERCGMAAMEHAQLSHSQLGY